MPAEPTVIVIGSLNADLLLDVERLPGPGETVTALRAGRAWGGKGANQAAAAARLGARTRFVGAVGRDEVGEEALVALERVGVDTSAVARVGEPTGSAHVLRDAAGENLIVVVPGANALVDPGHVESSLASISDGEVVVVSNLEIPDDAVLATARVCAERGWPFVLNPAPARPLTPELLALVTVLTPNAEEATGLGPSSPAALLAAGVDAVVVTRGADGVDVHAGEAGAEPARIAAFEVDVVDTIGAGDAFTAALAVALASGQPLAEAARLAVAAAAVAVTGPGARGADLSLAAAHSLLEGRPR